jgi:hypothetical protein
MHGVRKKGQSRMLTQTGSIVNLFVAPIAFLDAEAPDGVRIEDQINLTLKAAADDKEYQHALPIKGDTAAMKSLEEWQAQGKLVTIFSSSVRAVPFVHDTRKDEAGNPMKKYLRPGRKLTVGEGLAVEADAFLIFQSYDVQLAEQVGLAKSAEQARGDFLKRQQEFRKRSNQARVEKARQLVEERKAQAQAAKAHGADTARAGSRKSA